MWSHCQVPLFDKKIRQIYFSHCSPPVKSCFLYFRRRDEGASLVGHPVAWRALLFYPPIIAKTHHHDGFPWQQPFKESLHKQHRWVSYSEFVCLCDFQTQIKVFYSQWKTAAASTFWIKAIRTVRHNLHDDPFFFCLTSPVFEEMPIKGLRYLSQSTDSLNRTNQVTESMESLTDEGQYPHTLKSRTFLPCHLKLTKHTHLKHYTQIWSIV